MSKKSKSIFERLFKDYPSLSVCRSNIWDAYEAILDTYKSGGKMLICGNGGSASDSEHIVGELMKGFMLKRPISIEERNRVKSMFPADFEYLSDNLQGSLPAISLISQTAILSAFSNDVQPDMVFAQQVYGYGKQGDILLGLSTSGNSHNVVNAVKIARILGVKAIGITGQTGGTLKKLCDIIICVPAEETYKVQELHLPVYHTLCAMIEEEFFGEEVI